MKDRNEIRQDRLDDLNDHEADYLYGVIRGALFPEHTNHLSQLPLRVPFRPPTFDVQSL